ncbi:hypothetical protein [Nocardioides salsibiostraticola]
MTFALSLVSQKTIWLVVDRRISWDAGPPKDIGVKAMTVEASDGVVMLGYAGLGLTAGGTQPSSWMCNVLRGRNLSVEGCLFALAHEMQQHLRPHVASRWNQIVAAPAIVDGECRSYVIGLSDNGRVAFQRLHVRGLGRRDRLARVSPRAVYTGTGGGWLSKQRSRRVMLRELYSLAGKHDLGKASHFVVADRLAIFNSLASEKEPATVGPTCYVLWRRMSDTSGWEQQNYRGTDRVHVGAFTSVPHVSTHGHEDRGFDFPGIEYEGDEPQDRPDFRLR